MKQILWILAIISLIAVCTLPTPDPTIPRVEGYAIGDQPGSLAKVDFSDFFCGNCFCQEKALCRFVDARETGSFHARFVAPFGAMTLTGTHLSWQGYRLGPLLSMKEIEAALGTPARRERSFEFDDSIWWIYPVGQAELGIRFSHEQTTRYDLISCRPCPRHWATNPPCSNPDMWTGKMVPGGGCAFYPHWNQQYWRQDQNMQMGKDPWPWPAR